MIAALARRIASWFATLACASVLIFLALDVLPGDPAQVMLGPDAPPDAVFALRAKLGLDRPAPQRYAEWIAGLVRGDLGTSMTYEVPVSQLVGERLQLTFPLALLSITLSLAIAFVLGLLAAAHQNRIADWFVLGVTQLGIALPNFWLGLLLILVFSISLGWTGAGGFPGWDRGVLPALGALMLPAIALAAAQAAILSRVLRGSLLEVMREDFVQTARAKGLTRRQALHRHVLPNALIPVVTIAALQFAQVLAGTIVIENVFSLPGLGRLVFQSINQRDFVVVRNVVLLLAAAVITISFVVDMVYVLIDPRLRSRR